MDRKSQQDELKELPLLQRLRPQGDGFRLPESYLDTLREESLQRAKRPARQRSLTLLYRLASAAAIALLVVAAVVLIQRQSSAPGLVDAEALVAELSDEEILAYVDSHLEDFDVDLLLEAEDVIPLYARPDSISDDELLELIDDLSIEEVMEFKQ